MKRTRPQKPPVLMTQADYARHRKVTRQHISKLVKGGVLVLRGRQIEVAASDAILDDRAEVSPTAELPDAATGAKLADARLQREIYAGKLRRLEFEAKSGTLIPADKVTKKWTAIAEVVKSRLEAVPSKLAPQVAALSDVKAVRALLAEEMRQVLRSLADGVRNGR